MITLIALLAIVGAMVIIWRASDGFETASEYLGRNLSDGVRGATINAIGSSMPELFTTLFGLILLGHVDNFAFGIGTTAGSAIFNGMIIPAVVIFAVIGFGIAKRVNVSKKVILRDGLSLVAAEFILIFLISGNTLYWWHGVILMLTYAAYVIIMLKTMTVSEESEDSDEDDEEGSQSNRGFLLSLLTLDLESLIIGQRELKSKNAWWLLIVAMLVIGAACIGLVEACEALAGEMGLAPYFIAVVLASAATSVPDTILSYRDAMDGQYDDAVANALGSNIFDICFALGFPLFLYTIVYGPIEMGAETVQNVAELRISLLILTSLAFIVYYFNKGMGRLQGLLLLAMYFIFTVFVFAKGYNFPWAVEFGELLNLKLNSFRSLIGI
ncbi:MAG: sodium:calcium antiporter [Bacteroidetes bacterium]|nr:sodium:calcium antiporter [Verrucomicrobiota bacterium]MDA1148874.1 sodium:calcium antiporter [Bacteroidota bacterium]